jgi:hypothetical protein
VQVSLVSGAAVSRPGFSVNRRGARRGPKGYQRSDERLKEDISERMYANEQFDCSDVSVEVANGVVTLDGTVDDRYSKYMIEEMVDSIPGVKDVENRLRVSRGGDDQSSRSGSGRAGSSSSHSGSYGSAGGTSGTSMSGSRTSDTGSSAGTSASGSGRSSQSESGGSSSTGSKRSHS